MRFDEMLTEDAAKEVKRYVRNFVTPFFKYDESKKAFIFRTDKHHTFIFLPEYNDGIARILVNERGSTGDPLLLEKYETMDDLKKGISQNVEFMREGER